MAACFGEFVGDCGLTWQPVGDEQRLEVASRTDGGAPTGARSKRPSPQEISATVPPSIPEGECVQRKQCVVYSAANR